MKAPWWLWVGLGALLVASGYALCAVPAGRRSAADAATLASYKQSLAALQGQAAKLDTLYVHQRDTLKVLRTRWDTLKLVERFTDTLVSVDTLRLVVRVADSTINACSAALETCDQQKAVLRSIIAVDSGAIRALSRDLSRAKIRNRLGCSVGPSWNPKGSAYVGVSCGLRIF